MSGPSVAVLAGGLSAEREVSLHSGRRVAAALEESGLSTAVHDAGADLVPWLADRAPDVVWPVLHGPDGEDGSLHGVLELLGYRVVGSSAEGCRLSWDKTVAAAVVRGRGIATPLAATVPHSLLRDLGAATVLPSLAETIGLPAVVKPVQGGSSFGISIVTEVSQLAPAMVAALGHHPVCRVERYVTGVEVSTTVVADGAGLTALPVVEISPESGRYDYAARYTLGSTEFHCPARLTDEVVTAVRDAALLVHEALGLGHLSRSDWIVDDRGTPWFLEANTSPGMTASSIVPIAMSATDQGMAGWCRRLVESAAQPMVGLPG